MRHAHTVALAFVALVSGSAAQEPPTQPAPTPPVVKVSLPAPTPSRIELPSPCVLEIPWPISPTRTQAVITILKDHVCNHARVGWILLNAGKERNGRQIVKGKLTIIADPGNDKVVDVVVSVLAKGEVVSQATIPPFNADEGESANKDFRLETVPVASDSILRVQITSQDQP